ncbi:MAG TPA: hypothetical protein VF615_15205 [Longimicrobiaceae bacterium]|jgi:hypothetical protein
MRPGARLARGARAAARALLVAGTAACTAYRPVGGAPGAAVGPGRMEQARLVLWSGRRVEVRDLSVRGDSLVGFRGRGYDIVHAAFHVRDVARVERGEPSPGRTAAFAAALAAGAAVAYVVVEGSRVLGDPDY